MKLLVRLSAYLLRLVAFLYPPGHSHALQEVLLALVQGVLITLSVTITACSSCRHAELPPGKTGFNPRTFKLCHLDLEKAAFGPRSSLLTALPSAELQKLLKVAVEWSSPFVF
jgi:hypothetical protein